MVQEQADLIRSQIQLRTVFTPGAPVRRVDLLAGRRREIGRVISAVSQVGQHAIIFGERGVGKTSLAGLIHEIWSEAAKDIDRLVAPRVNCDTGDDFQSIWAKISEDIRLVFDRRGVDLKSLTGNGVFQAALTELESGSATPAAVRRALQLADYSFIIVIDEFDRLDDRDAARMVADTIKMLSDHWVDATLIVVGVADTVDELIEEHASIDRCIAQVLVPRMTSDELQEIVQKGLAVVSMAVDEQALARITSLSQGLPHYTHLLALTSAHEALQAGRREVIVEDVRLGLDAAVEQTQETIRSAYHQATASPRKENLYKQVLLACALAPVDDLGYFAPADVRRPMTSIMGKAYDIPSYIRHLHELCNEKRGRVLQSSGEQRKRRYRFRNPLLEPYILLRGYREGLLPDENLPPAT